MMARKYLSLLCCAGALTACAVTAAHVDETETGPESCRVELLVLGAGQDAGAPQIGNPNDPAWSNPSLRLSPASLALIDHRASKRFLFEATPDLTDQLQHVDAYAPPHKGPKPEQRPGLGIDGIFLTHAHIGHYAGLIYLGREAAGAANVPVYVMPRFANYLRRNGPWEQLVTLGNIALRPLQNGEATPLTSGMSVTPIEVPHRDEYSETIGFLIKTDEASALFLPDIDSWDLMAERSGNTLESILKTVDYAFIDATFFDDNELPGRDMSKIPHPRVTDTMARLNAFPDEVRARVHFIHYNHTNPLRDAGSRQTLRVLESGFNIARKGDAHCLLN